MKHSTLYRFALCLAANVAASSMVHGQTSPSLQRVTVAPQLESPKTETPSLAPLPQGEKAPAATLDRPPWLADKAPATEKTKEKTVGGDQLRSAFEYRPTRSATPPPVRLASQQSVAPVSDPAAGPTNKQARYEQDQALKAAKAEKLAHSAKTVGDLNDVLELCGFDLGSETSRSVKPTDADDCPFEMRTVAAWALNRRGEMRLAAGDERTAFEDFQAAIAVDRRCWSAWHNRAVTLAQYGQAEQALTDFATTLELNPRFATAYGNRGQLYYQVGKLKPAVQDYTTAIKMADGNTYHISAASLADWHWGRSLAYRALGSSRAAMQDLDRVLQINPQRYDVYAQRAGLFFDVGYYEAALADYEEAIQLASEGDSHTALREAYLGLTWLLAACPDERFRNPPEAVTAANIAMQLTEEVTPRLLDAVAVARASTGDFSTAIRETQQAILMADDTLAKELTGRLDLYRRREAYVLPEVASNP